MDSDGLDGDKESALVNIVVTAAAQLLNLAK